MFSIIIPLYNKSAYIEKAVQSVLNQSNGQLELIIVNDGSTDNSLEVVKQYSDPRIRIINQKNKGVSAARNRGVKVSKYKYIAFLDADDWWDPDYLQEMNELINEYPEAGMWASKYYKVKNKINIEANIGIGDGFNKGYIEYFKAYSRTRWMPLTSSSFIVSKPVFEEHRGFDTGLKFGEDFHLWSRIALDNKIAFINKPLVYYNQDLDSNERAVGGRRIYAPEHHFIFHLDELKARESYDPDLKILLDKLRLSALLRYRLSGKYRKETRKVLREVDFSKQSVSWKLKYHAPLFMVKIWFESRKTASAIKRKLSRKN